MAKQIGAIKLKGLIDDLVFYKSGDGYIARMSTPISAARIATDPSYIRTRENMAEFSRSGKGAKLLRAALRSELQKASDSKAHARLVKEMMRVIKSDATNGRGLRNLVDGEKTLLQGFDFNANAKLDSTFFAPYTMAIDRTSGDSTVTVAPFVPVNSIEAPAGATHFRINAAVAAVDFEGETYEYNGTSSTTLPLNGTETTTLTLTCSLAAGITLPLFLVVGVEFFQEVNQTNYSLNNGAFNPLAIAKVNQE